MLRRGFTLIEILLVMGILVILTSFVYTKMRSITRTQQAYDIKRKADVQAMERAASQYIIDYKKLPPGVPVGNASAAKSVCRSTVTESACTSAGGINLSSLIPTYLTDIPVDPSMTGATLTGYNIYSDGEDVLVVATLLGTNPGGGTGGGSSAGGGASSSVASSTLVAHWQLDERSGGVAADASGNGRTGTLENGPTWTLGLLGNALQFDGSNDVVTIADHPSLDGFAAFTLSAWVYPYAYRASDIAGISDAYQLRLQSDGRVLFSARPMVPSAFSLSTLPLNQWTHLALRYDGTRLRLYVNGVVDSSVNAAGTVASTATPLRIGGGSSTWSGRIDDVRVLSRAMSDGEIGQLAREGLNGTLALRWRFDEGSGAAAADASGNGRSGTLTNGPLWNPANTAPTGSSNPYALSFNGSNQYVIGARALSVTDDWTLSAWARPATINQWTAFIVFNGDDRSGYGFAISNGNELWGLFPGSSWLNALYNFPAANQWYHVAMVRSNGTTRFYVNGNLTPSASQATPLPPGTSFAVARHPAGSSFFSGAVDDVQAWSRPLTSAEIQAIANGSSLP